jgi:hypothetical protein
MDGRVLMLGDLNLPGGWSRKKMPHCSNVVTDLESDLIKGIRFLTSRKILGGRTGKNTLLALLSFFSHHLKPMF